MAEPYTSSGTKLYISDDVPATLDEAGYTAGGVVYSEVGQLISLGDELGRVYSEVTLDLLNERQTKILKGQFTEGKVTATMARDPNDGGQAIILTALNVDDLYTFKIEHGDGTDAMTPTIQYWRGGILSYKTTGLSANSVVGAEVIISTNTPILEIAPEAIP